MRSVKDIRWQYLGVAASLLLFIAALVALHHILAEVHLRDVLARFHEIPLSSVLLAQASAAGSYLALTGYDVLALRHLGKPMSYRRAALASFASYAFSHNIGLSLITGGSIRYRIYSAVGLSASEIASLTLFCAITFGLGASLLLGTALLLEPTILSTADSLPAGVNRALGGAIILVVGAYLLWTGLWHRPLRVKGWALRLPRMPLPLGQLGLGAIDITCAAGTLFLVLPPDAGIGFPAFLGIYVAAVTVGVLSHSPGGIGVFEAVMLLALPHSGQDELLGSLLVCRCLYYLVPLAAAAAALSWYEVRLRVEAFKKSWRVARRISHAAAPPLIGTAVLAGGAILLFSAATPAIEERMAVLHFLPLPFVEASHLLSSIVGLTLMILARGLFRRLDGAFHLTAALLFAGAVFSLAKGFDYEEAMILLGVLALLLASRSAFYRRASLLNQPFSVPWIATIAMIIAASVWIGIFAYKHLEYSNTLWWEFAYRADAPRFLRASLAVVAVAVGLLAYILTRPAVPRGTQDPGVTNTVRRIVAASPRSDANLALTGGKRFIVSENGDAFIMYAIKGRSWVSMGDPVGAEGDWEGLVWQFCELCDRYGGWPVFYQVRVERLPLYLDLGLSLLKLGEAARIDLANFSLEGSGRRDLRYAERRAVREGAQFEVVPAAQVEAILPELRRVSDAWLAAKATAEKGFSVGAFSEGYMRNFDCAVVRRGGRVVAFANVWGSPAGQEIAIDLMRHDDDAPYGIMDFLFVRLMLWAKEQGYRWFDLGMAPLSGLDNHPLGSLWQRAGAFMFRHGEHFYNFAGLRAFKEKFNPIWTPRYIAVAGGMALPRILLDVKSLISDSSRVDDEE